MHWTFVFVCECVCVCVLAWMIDCLFISVNGRYVCNFKSNKVNYISLQHFGSQRSSTKSTQQSLSQTSLDFSWKSLKNRAENTICLCSLSDKVPALIIDGGWALQCSLKTKGSDFRSKTKNNWLSLHKEKWRYFIWRVPTVYEYFITHS